MSKSISAHRPKAGKDSQSDAADGGRSRHKPVLADEAVTALVTDPGGVYVDCTFGAGGHSRKILEALSDTGRLVAIDRDLETAQIAAEIEDNRFRFLRGNFADIDSLMEQAGITTLDGILMDVGVSSMQLESPERGFSFRFKGPLDMRMDAESGQTAAQWLESATFEEIAKVLREYGEVHRPQSLARRLDRARRVPGGVRTTRALVDALDPPRQRGLGTHPATQVFQALRIKVNDELNALHSGIEKGVRLLAGGGRLAVITFHSLEDRIVKNFILGRWGDCKMNVIHRLVRPGGMERHRNPRARSAKMRVAEKREQE